MSKVAGVKDLCLFRIIGQPNLTFTVDRKAAARWGINVADIQDALQTAVEGAVLRLRPIMMTVLVATLGLLPAAMSHGIGSDSQRPFAIVIVGGLISDLVMSIFLLPTLYVWIARDNDVLPMPEMEFEN